MGNPNEKLELVIEVNNGQANAALAGTNNSLSSLERQAAQSARVASGGMDQMGVDMMKARGSAMLLESYLGVKLPRAVNTFLARSSLLGPTMEAVFGVAAFSAIGVGLVKGAEMLLDWASNTTKIKEDTDHFEATTKKYVEHVKELRNELELIGTGGMIKMQIEFSQAADKIRDTTKEADSLRTAYQKLAEESAKQKADVEWQKKNAMFGSMYASAGMQMGLNALFGVSDKEVQAAFDKYQAAQMKERDAETKWYEDQQKLFEDKEKKRIDLLMVGIEAQWKGREIAGLTVEIKRQEQILQEAIANNYADVAEVAKRTLVSDQAGLKIAQDLYDIRREEAGQTAGAYMPADVLKKQEELTASLIRNANPGGNIDAWVKKFNDELEQAQSQRAAADSINLETAKLTTSEEYRQLQAESDRIGKIQAATPQEKMMIEQRKADVDYRLAVEKTLLDYKTAILALDKEEHDLLKDSTIPESPELKAAFAARRKQLAENEGNDIKHLQGQRDQAGVDAQKESLRGYFVDNSYSGQLAQIREYYKQLEELKAAGQISDEKYANARKKLDEEELHAKVVRYQTFFGTLSEMQSSNIRALAVVGKAAAIAQATINTYVAATDALAYSGHGIAGFAQMAAVMAVGFAQVAQISAQGFAAGGLITGGERLIRANEQGPEFMMNSSATKDYLPLLQMLNSGRTVGSQMDNGPSLNGWPKQQLNVTIANYGTSKQFEVEHLDENTVRIIARDEAKSAVYQHAPNVIANDLTYANSKTSKAIARHTTARRGDR